ncbi:MAG: transketolase [Anaerolineaceae bacterium]|nr:transketolase [Anaerolineaceae bacterium]
MSVLTQEQITFLEGIAQTLRADSLQLIHRRGAGHPGGALSAAEILAVLYFQVLHIDPKKPQMTDRDRFILSKGHASAVLYAALTRRGFFSIRELDNWGEVDCPHQGHPDRIKTPGVDMTSGILGHGVAIGAGLALAARMNHSLSRTYVLIGDGESQAGIVWEGAATAAKYHLSNLVTILDLNDVQLDGPVHEIMPMDNMAERWKACGWYVIEVNGHNVRQLAEAFDLAREIHDKPVCVIARTTKGKGVSFMENDSYWHGNVPNADQLKQAQAELGVREVTHG